MNDKKQIVINSPYTEPSQYLKYHDDTERFTTETGRRPSGFWIERRNETREFFPIKKVNEIRPLVKAWRESGYAESTDITRELLSHWHDRRAREDTPFFWCQLEAIETLIFLAETHSGVIVADDGSPFDRICTKLCTGGGKTIVMSMLIAWQVCNFAENPAGENYTRNFLIVAPNLTVKKRLEVLIPNTPENYYAKFSVVPESMREIMNQSRIVIHNWQYLDDESRIDPAKNKSVVKKPARSDESYCQKIIGDMKNIIVINDEAHHAYRFRPEDLKPKTQEEKENLREATVWITGLDRIHSGRGIKKCYDFTATPFVPGREKESDKGVFSWIVSDYSLDDGIEAGIVKTPCITVRDNTPPDPVTGKSVFYHIYPKVKDDLNHTKEITPLPDLVRNAYMLLGHDWQEVFRTWNNPTPPVMITVANNTNTAARIEHEFTEGINIDIPELRGEDYVLRIDSDKLKKESARADELREKANTVGQPDKPGANLRNIISVGMLSEGWDARTVTQIMGLRAFTSQLLCEQVVGRGLRRSSYEAVGENELFTPEYVNVFGVPFAYLLTEEISERELPTIDRRPPAEVRVVDERSQYAITWPEVESINYVMRQNLTLDVSAIPEMTLDASATRISAELAAVVDGKENLDALNNIDLDKIYGHERMQRIIFRTAANVFGTMKRESHYDWQNGSTFHLLGEIVRLTEQYISGGNIKIKPERFVTDIRRKKILLCFNMEKIISHMWQGIRSDNVDRLIPILRQGKFLRSTSEMETWRTSRPHHETVKSHINICTFDSTWESSAAYCLDHNENVKAWAKNDHLGFFVRYSFGGLTRRYLPDFLVRLKNDKMLVLEVKGVETDESRAKHKALREWCEAVSNVKTYGEWVCDTAYSPLEIDGIIAECLKSS